MFLWLCNFVHEACYAATAFSCEIAVADDTLGVVLMKVEVGV